MALVLNEEDRAIIEALEAAEIIQEFLLGGG